MRAVYKTLRNRGRWHAVINLFALEFAIVALLTFSFHRAIQGEWGLVCVIAGFVIAARNLLVKDIRVDVILKEDGDEV